MKTLTANDLKSKGIAIIDEFLKDAEELIIEINEKAKFVVMDLAKYNKLRDYELIIALQDAKADLMTNNVNTGSVAEHMLLMFDKQ